MRATGQPVMIGDVKVGEVVAIEEDADGWHVRYVITDVAAAQRAGLDALGMMTGGTMLIPRRETLGHELGQSAPTRPPTSRTGHA